MPGISTAVWMHCHRVAAEARKGVRGELARLGIQVRDAGSSPQDSGILLFGSVDRDLVERVRRMVRCGCPRILALAIGDAALRPNRAAWRLLRAGASDVLAWDGTSESGRAVAARLRRWREADELADSPAVQDFAVGRSPAWRATLRRVVEVARFTDVSVLILGETGTGKEMVARLVHQLDQRSDKASLVVLDCTTVVPDLSGSEFFGHEQGAFTGADSAREGAFALAHRGTLFLDEVADLPLPLQAQLLRVVQEGTYKRVGGDTWKHTRFRLVCATNKDLPETVRRGGFRRDLYYRIANWTCWLPPLRERREDILPLVWHFLGEICPQVPELDESVKRFLLERDYPGNVRELKQLVTSLLCHHAGCGPITAGQIPPEQRPVYKGLRRGGVETFFERGVRRALARGLGLKEIGRRAEDAAIRIATQLEDGNLQRAARRLGVTDRTLQMRRKKPPRVEKP